MISLFEGSVSEEEDQRKSSRFQHDNAELGHNAAKRLKKCHENYTSKGPPVGENPTVEIFHAWKANLKIFIESMPGYVNGMLKKETEF